MDLNQKIIAGLLLAFFLITLLRIFRTPLRLALKLLMNTALGFLALWAVNATAAVTGVALGLNLLNALTVGVLGLPGFVLLLLAQWVLYGYIACPAAGDVMPLRYFQKYNFRFRKIIGEKRRF